MVSSETGVSSRLNSGFPWNSLTGGTINDTARSILLIVECGSDSVPNTGVVLGGKGGWKMIAHS